MFIRQRLIQVRSHSLRSAWIEIGDDYFIGAMWNIVALLTECVDRNLSVLVAIMGLTSRTPYGVRG